MGKVTFTSETTRIKRPSDEVYAFLSDLNHFEHMMPEQVINWQSTTDHCTFTIKKLATLGLRIDNRIPGQQVLVVSDGKAPFDFNLSCNLNPTSASSTEVIFEITADLSPMFKMMVSNPLSNLVNIMAGKLKEEMEVR